MHIYLVRHTKYHNPENIFPFHLPVSLSVEGREHAERVANWFAAENLQKLPIFTSPIVRCVQTAEIISAKTHSFVLADERLMETSSPGLQGARKPEKETGKLKMMTPLVNRFHLFARELSRFLKRKWPKNRTAFSCHTAIHSPFCITT